VAFYDFLANCQANPRAWILLPGVQSLEDQENAVRKLRIDADPVVPNRE
jgi:hypothetical protein